jgi:hypothetical protein
MLAPDFGSFQKIAFHHIANASLSTICLAQICNYTQLAWINNPSEQIKSSEQKMQYESEKLKYFATAYNCGFTNTESHINKMITQKHFTTHFFADENTIYYCYADIAVWWFEGKK